MTFRIGDTLVICVEQETLCARCGRLEECRDVLGDGVRICLRCTTDAEKNVYLNRMFGADDDLDTRH